MLCPLPINLQISVKKFFVDTHSTTLLTEATLWQKLSQYSRPLILDPYQGRSKHFKSTPTCSVDVTVLVSHINGQTEAGM